ncbi:eukaryotic rRNA processing protein EBP2-domain-containing protein [Microdochium trichocladiopsis]|uniref:Eukaryotic rRNA processing protein EBP2-domain-containing protein n=1 Tax=Microdochium trichocladiopsis TaxID=1682393 RepID=A0A9P8Y9U5_9PEZI|nr:eukaryotic rRNA processing protein EBP2-domain-containing protein [Microdochium trichocladiopsis]KAH7033241.1 eukaryotic rRNA processing protein EBP2-domain-containing protein [Microdochium trichocladiopsis]
MVTKSRLKMALAAERGVDFKKFHDKKQRKEAEKKKQVKGKSQPAGEDQDDEEWEDDEEDVEEGGALVEDDDDDDDDDEDDEEVQYDLAALDESDSDESEVEMEEKIARKPKTILKAKNAKPEPKAAGEDEDDEEEDPEEDDIPMSDLEDLDEEEKEDLVPHQRLTINNTSALLAALHRISIPTDKSVAFATHQTVVSSEPTASMIEDIQDDLKRELAFYAQSLEAAKRGRALLKAEGVPFARPTDYFAEMVKDDDHMGKVKAKMVEEASAKKASAEARKQRELKKFGKQVQQAKLQERNKAKKETLEKIQSLKRKRTENSGDVGATEADLFDVGVDAELNKHKSQRAFSRGKDGDAKTQHVPNAKRQKKNEKYGFGGKKKHSKSGDAISSGDMSGFSAKRMKTGAKGKIPKTARLGKNRRKAVAGKR